jgi:hypothetical protein
LVLGLLEETFQTEKGLAGLDVHQVRRFVSWTRWVTLAMLAHAFLAVVRADEHAVRTSSKGFQTAAKKVCTTARRSLLGAEPGPYQSGGVLTRVRSGGHGADQFLVRPHGPPPHRRDHHLLARPEEGHQTCHSAMKHRKKSTS